MFFKAAAIAQLQQQYQQQQSSGQGQTNLVSGSTSSPVISQQRVVTTVPVLSNQTGQTQRIVTRGKFLILFLFLIL